MRNGAQVGLVLRACPPLQHYTTDADGLCTRLIKPKVMEGTVAAQDEFYRSECTRHLTSHLPTSLTWALCPYPRGLETPDTHT